MYMLKYIVVFLFLLFSSLAAYARDNICQVSNVYAGLVTKNNVQYIIVHSSSELIKGSQLTHLYPMNTKPAVTDVSTMYMYKSDMDNGIAVKVANDDTCSITFLIKGKAITFDGRTKKLN